MCCVFVCVRISPKREDLGLCRLSCRLSPGGDFPLPQVKGVEGRYCSISSSTARTWHERSCVLWALFGLQKWRNAFLCFLPRKGWKTAAGVVAGGRTAAPRDLPSIRFAAVTAVRYLAAAAIFIVGPRERRRTRGSAGRDAQESRVSPTRWQCRNVNPHRLDRATARRGRCRQRGNARFLDG